jgi:hypothetical protein
MASIYGTAVRSDGSKVDRTTRISTSWNSHDAFPHDGEYELELGSNPKQSITLYVDGMTYTEVYVDGDTRVDIHL